MTNTNWGLVRRLVWHDDGSTDGTRDWVERRLWAWGCAPGVWGRVQIRPYFERVGGPVAIMRHYLARPDGAEVFAKLDSDCVVPPGWLDAAWGAWRRANPTTWPVGDQSWTSGVAKHDPLAVAAISRTPLDLLGIEGSFGKRSARPCTIAEATRDQRLFDVGVEMITPSEAARECEPARYIGGVGLMRRAAFERHPLGPSRGFNGVFGFYEWQLEHADVVKGWLSPPVPLVLLDRLPFSPWVELGKEYEMKGWQRPWEKYDINADRDLWVWWSESGDPTGAPR